MPAACQQTEAADQHEDPYHAAVDGLPPEKPQQQERHHPNLGLSTVALTARRSIMRHKRTASWIVGHAAGRDASETNHHDRVPACTCTMPASLRRSRRYTMRSIDDQDITSRTPRQLRTSPSSSTANQV